MGKTKIIVQRGGVERSLIPLPLARNKENENIESRILIGCTMYTMQYHTGLYSAGCKENIAVDKPGF